MKKTTLYDKHTELKAKMVPFADYMMPLQFSSIREEHMAVREKAGLFDVSHMGEFIIKGKDAEDFLNYVTSNDVRSLSIGQAQYTCMPMPEGGIVDDLILYRLAENNCSEGEKAYMLVVNASNIEKDWNWLVEHKEGEVRMEDISDKTTLFALQGPKATPILQKLTETEPGEIKFYHYDRATVADIDNVIISATGYTGSGGYELYLRNDNAERMWDAIMEAGEEYDLVPAGLGARDTLRLEMGFNLYGHEINEDTSTLESRLGWITKFDKGDFIGKDFLLSQKENGIERSLIGFTLDGRRVPRQDYSIVEEKGEKVGFVTSGTQSPCLDKPIGMGYVNKSADVEHLSVQIRKKTYPLEKVKLPFYKG